ncbi:MAG TPA: hypothetical protein DEH22_04870 [Chloroflexi bacterium]|nr:hypothetical protein [Chloroflexota bacterium]
MGEQQHRSNQTVRGFPGCIQSLDTQIQCKIEHALIVECRGHCGEIFIKLAHFIHFWLFFPRCLSPGCRLPIRIFVRWAFWAGFFATVENQVNDNHNYQNYKSGNDNRQP